jgi:hypothetical protein
MTNGITPRGSGLGADWRRSKETVRKLCLAVLVGLGSNGPALADCAFGGPCGDGSPYDRLFQHDSDSDHNLGWSHEVLAPPSYYGGSRDNGFGYQAPSYGGHRSDDDDE